MSNTAQETCRKGHPMEPDWVEMGVECPKCLNIREPLPGVPHKRGDSQSVHHDEQPICEKCGHPIASRYLDGRHRCGCPLPQLHPYADRPKSKVEKPAKPYLRLSLVGQETCPNGHPIRLRWRTCPRCLPKDPDGFPEQWLTHNELKKSSYQDSLDRGREKRGRGPGFVRVRVRTDDTQAG